MKKLCFGAYANVLVLCAARKTTKLKLLNCIVRSVDPSCSLSSNAVTALLCCRSNLPDGRSNSLGNVFSGAQETPSRAVAEYFSKKVVTLIDPNKRKLVILALRGIIADDETINDDTVVEGVSGTTKKDLLSQDCFTLSDFLAGI